MSSLVSGSAGVTVTVLRASQSHCSVLSCPMRTLQGWVPQRMACPCLRVCKACPLGRRYRFQASVKCCVLDRGGAVSQDIRWDTTGDIGVAVPQVLTWHSSGIWDAWWPLDDLPPVFQPTWCTTDEAWHRHLYAVCHFLSLHLCPVSHCPGAVERYCSTRGSGRASVCLPE